MSAKRIMACVAMLLVMAGAAGAVASTTTVNTVESVLVFPAKSVAVALNWYVPSASVVPT